ncbi:DUF4145 domain-containing protein [Sanguibacter sp. 4.1]|uniref:DUF4145 domain-containing protein n=1 Tax=Sanguibacter biliveldensis TaxID=3030830 RepID=A0AAF0Z6N9_9MICO|nr:DUF4145 domain-containing protein [Sanguibacter sp. 4.1]WPF83715.1 DUF4145 domain-containing protein [Sanguibacter sp. 4.1]
MATIICGWCGDKSHMTPVGKPIVHRVRTYGHDERWVADAAYTCDGCERMSVVTWTTSHDLSDRWLEDYGHNGGPQDYEDARWSPPPGHDRSLPDVPDDIARAAAEAWLCHVVGATRGACALARAVVEATAKKKQFTSGNLVAKIDALAGAGLIRDAVRGQAHEIRFIGNDVAHGDLDRDVSEEESSEVLELMGELLTEVFQAPARRERLRAARVARTAGPVAEDTPSED